jgi:cellulose synthase/poly-beta-1,6-N-acetylglucosamine synthase-like glycosyltransferase
MLISEILFWLSLSVLFYCYIGYGILVFTINAITRPFKKNKSFAEADLPPVTLIITAYNEAGILEEKIANTHAIDYPAELFSVIIITDGSQDDPDQLLQNHPSFLHLHQEQRSGKLAAVKRAMKEVKSPMVVFSDANSMLNAECIKRIVQHYHDVKVGGVAGEKKILAIQGSAVGRAEGMYWQYESFMKKQDAELNTVVGAAGELFSIRTEFFDPPADNIILDDFVISMNVCLKGKKIAYEPRAYATEMPSASLMEESKRKIRISAGAYQSIGVLSPLLNIFKTPLLSLQYISRRILRWVICPVMIIILLFSNIFLTVRIENSFFFWMLVLQSVIYFSALAGWFLMKKNRTAGVFSIPFYFLFMNYCMVRGFIRFLKKDQLVTWEKAKRMSL